MRAEMFKHWIRLCTFFDFFRRTTIFNPLFSSQHIININIKEMHSWTSTFSFVFVFVFVIVFVSLFSPHPPNLLYTPWWPSPPVYTPPVSNTPISPQRASNCKAWRGATLLLCLCQTNLNIKHSNISEGPIPKTQSSMYNIIRVDAKVHFEILLLPRLSSHVVSHKRYWEESHKFGPLAPHVTFTPNYFQLAFDTCTTNILLYGDCNTIYLYSIEICIA